LRGSAARRRRGLAARRGAARRIGGARRGLGRGWRERRDLKQLRAQPVTKAPEIAATTQEIHARARKARSGGDDLMKFKACLALVASLAATGVAHAQSALPLASHRAAYVISLVDSYSA